MPSGTHSWSAWEVRQGPTRARCRRLTGQTPCQSWRPGSLLLRRNAANSAPRGRIRLGNTLVEHHLGRGSAGRGDHGPGSYVAVALGWGPGPSHTDMGRQRVRARTRLQGKLISWRVFCSTLRKGTRHEAAEHVCFCCRCRARHHLVCCSHSGFKSTAAKPDTFVGGCRSDYAPVQGWRSPQLGVLQVMATYGNSKEPLQACPAEEVSGQAGVGVVAAALQSRDPPPPTIHSRDSDLKQPRSVSSEKQRTDVSHSWRQASEKP